MAKKKIKKSEMSKFATLIATVLGVVAVIMMFLPAIAVKDTETTYTGLQIAFGYAESGLLNKTVTVFNFSIMNLLTYALAIVGVVFVILGYLGKGSKFATLIATVAFIVSGIFFFLSIGFCLPNEDASSIVGFLGGNIKDAYVLGIGSIVGGICSILAGVASFVKIAVSK